MDNFNRINALVEVGVRLPTNANLRRILSLLDAELERIALDEAAERFYQEMALDRGFLPI